MEVRSLLVIGPNGTRTVSLPAISYTVFADGRLEILTQDGSKTNYAVEEWADARWE